MKVRLADQAITINAPRPLVFGMFFSFGEGYPPNEYGERATALEQSGNRLLMEFVSREGKRLYRTLEEVTLFPPERITFRHLKGPLRHASEEFQFAEAAAGTSITYRGRIECRMPWLPGVGWLVARWYVRPKYGRVVKRHMSQLKDAAEGGGGPLSGQGVSIDPKPSVWSTSHHLDASGESVSGST